MIGDEEYSVYFDCVSAILNDCICIESKYSFVFVGKNIAIKLQKRYSSIFGEYNLNQLKIIAENEFQRGKIYAPDVYLAVIPLHNKDGLTINYGIVEKSLLKSNLLANKIGTMINDDLAELYSTIVSFYYSASAFSDANRYYQMILEGNLRLVEQLKKQTHVESDMLLRYWYNLDEYLQKHRTELIYRVRKGYVKELHGDLSFNNIFYNDVFCFIDPCSGNADLYTVDILSEFASIALECLKYKKTDFYGYIKKRTIESEFEYCDELFYCYIARHALIRASINWLGNDKEYKEYKELLLYAKPVQEFFNQLLF